MRGVALLLLLVVNVALSGQVNTAYPLIKTYQQIKTDQPIWDFMLDKQKNLWLATKNGVVKHTGYRQITYKIPDGLNDNFNFGCFQDSKDRIWFKSFSGEVAYFHNGKFYNYLNSPLCRSLSFVSYIRQIFEYNGKLVFVSYTNGSKVWDQAKNKITTLKTGSVKDACLANGKLTLLLTEGLFSINLENYKIRKLHENNFSADFACISHQPRFDLISYGAALYKWNGSELLFLAAFDKKEQEIIDLCPINDSIYLLGTRTGIAIFNMLTNQLRFQPLGAEVYKIRKIEEELLFSLGYQGLCKASNLSELFPVLFPVNQNSTINTDDKGNIWVGQAGNKLSKFDAGMHRTDFNFSHPSIKTDRVMDIKHTTNGYTYVLGKVFLAVLKNGKILKMFTQYGGNELLIDETGQKLWIRYNSLSSFDLNDGLIIPEAHFYVTKRFGKFLLINGQLWGSINRSLYKVTATDSLETVHAFDFRIIDFNNRFVLLENGQLYEKKGNGYRQFRNMQPPRESFLFFTCTGTHCFLASEKAIYAVDLTASASGYKKIFNAENITGILVKGNEVYIQCLDFLIKKPLTELLKNTRQNTISFHLDSVKAANKRISFKNPLVLNYSQRNVTLFYSLIGHFQKAPVYYKIDEADWTETSNFFLDQSFSTGLHHIWFSYLPDGIPDAKNGFMLTLTVKKPFWLQVRFYLLSALVITFGLYLLYQNKLKKIKSEHEKQQAAERLERERLIDQRNKIELEQKALRMQMNPHFIFNAINTIKGFYAEKEAKKGSIYINTFAKLLRNVLENEKFIHPLSNELEIVTSFLQMQQVKFPLLTYTVTKNISENDSFIGVPSMFLQPFVENSILHGIAPNDGRGNIEINIDQQGDWLTIMVVDNGIGPTETVSKHTSKSMEITEKRLQILNEGSDFELKLYRRHHETILLIKTRFVRISTSHDEA